MTYADENAARAALTSGTAIPADLRQIVISYPALRPAVAAYPATDEAMLDWLRELQDPLVDSALAARSQPAAPESLPPPAGEARSGSPSTSAATPPDSPLPGAAGAAPVSTAPLPPTTPQLPTDTRGQPRSPQPSGSLHPGAPAPTPPAGPAYPGQPTGDGGPVPIVPAAPGPPTFTALAPPPGRSGGGPAVRIAIVIAAVVVLVGGGMFLAFASGLMPGFGTSGPPPSLAPSTTEPSDGEPTGLPSASVPTPIKPPSVGPSPVGFACWDASEADSLADCPAPRSRDEAWRYLRYVYPSLVRHDDCTQADSTGKSDYQGVTVMWECDLGDSLLRYRYWVDPTDAERHYDRKFRDSTAETYDVAINGRPVAGWVKTSEEPIAKQSDGSRRYVATMWLPELQLSMSAEGNDTTAMWQAFELVRIRPLEQLNGHQRGADPREVPLTIVQR